MRRRPVTVTVTVAASPERVWRALTRPEEVRAWDGARPLEVPTGYPMVGQQARWRTRLGPVPLTLHDRVVVVEPGHRLAATLTYAFVHLDEEYRLAPGPAGGTTVTSGNRVGSRVPGLGWWARRLVAGSVPAAMARLVDHCDTAP
ncbi:MAG: SRPBCC family protein [Acidimicrobiales bacterium]